MKKVIIALLAVLILGGAGAAFMLLRDAPAAASGGAEAGPGAAPEEGAGEPEGEPLYLALEPAFVVNFEHQGNIRYLQLGLQVMAHEQSVLDKVAAHMPAVRNRLIMLLSGQEYAALSTVAGKDALRGQLLAAINEQLRLTAPERVDEVYFTAFVVQ